MGTMQSIINALAGIFTESWSILVEAAPYVLLGFAAAGLLKGFLLNRFIARHIGKNSIGSVLKASLFGIPLPLCSCGVIPAAVELRKQGASRGGAAAFLVSTPESGVDSIAVTYALLDPVMTVIRPVAAFVTATVTGLAVNRLPEERPAEAVPPQLGCGCPPEPELDPDTAPLRRRLEEGVSYAFSDLLRDIGGWLLLGIVIAGLIGYFVPDRYFATLAGDELSSLVVMLLVGIPLYICASASTPVAAALILKGVSPGAALVFLLAGPATNAATITIVGRFWGRAATVVYLASIAACSLVIGWLTNRLYEFAGWDITRSVRAVVEEDASVLATGAAILLLVLIARSFLLPAMARRDGGRKADS